MSDFAIGVELTYHDCKPTHRVVPDIVTQARSEAAEARKKADALIERRLTGRISDDEYCLLWPQAELDEVLAENRERDVVRLWNMGLLIETGAPIELSMTDYATQA